MNLIKNLVVIALKTITILFVFVYIPACFVYLISPGAWWPMGILSIGFPYLWFFLSALIIGWFYMHRKTAGLLFILLLAGLPVIKNVIAVSFPRSFTVNKKPGNARIMQWNCNGLQGNLPNTTQLAAQRYKAVQFINKYQPDIICIQDFSEIIAEGVNSNIALIKDSLGYPYYLFTQHYQSKYPTWQDGIGIAIFSKYPIKDSGCLSYPGKIHPETIIWATIGVGNKQLRVATTHLQSMHLGRDAKLPLDKDLWQDSVMILHGSKIAKLQYFQPYHAIQSSYLRAFLDTCKTPLVFTADLNSVPSSYVYHTVKGNLQDAFLANSAGFGRTYHSRQPALRIDYVFYNDAINASQTSLFRTTFSDHDPVLMDFSLR